MYQEILLNIYIYSHAPVNQFTGTIAHSCVKNLLLKKKNSWFLLLPNLVVQA